jgi:hypothetical protein
MTPKLPPNYYLFSVHLIMEFTSNVLEMWMHEVYKLSLISNLKEKLISCKEILSS